MGEIKAQCLKCKKRRSVHHTRYVVGRGCLPLCQRCFDEADRYSIIYWYGELVCIWRKGGGYYTPADEAVIINAALREKGFGLWEPPTSIAELAKREAL